MAHEPYSSQVHYGPHHQMARSPHAHRWKVVPADFISELRQADLSVDVVERRCPRCGRPPRHGLPIDEPPQPH
jgi:hypothetical protein